jgi:hypothetical protein
MAALTNCTVSGNSATKGGGLYNIAVEEEIPTRLTDTIVARNTDGSRQSDIAVKTTVAGSYNLVGTVGTGGLTNGVDGNIVGVTNPGLASLGNYGGLTQTIALLPGSPAIDAGTSGSGIPSTDQRGKPRVGAVDIGAFESQGFTLTPVAGSTPQKTPVNTAFANPLAVVVTAKNPVEPVVGGTVTFTAPATGASTRLSSPNPVTIGSNGQASVSAVVNATAGSYTVTASTAGAASIAFDLTNTAASSAIEVASDPAPRAKGSPSSPLEPVVPASSRGPATVSLDLVDQVLGALANDTTVGVRLDDLALDPVGPRGHRSRAAS